MSEAKAFLPSASPAFIKIGRRILSMREGERYYAKGAGPRENKGPRLLNSIRRVQEVVKSKKLKHINKE